MADPMVPPKPMAPQAPQQPNQFEAMRRRLQTSNQQQLNQAQAQQSEALKRRFASAGLGNSGTAIRAEQIGQQELADQFGRQLNDAQGGLDQLEAQQEFQAAEAQKQRDFQGGQFDKSFGLDEKTKLGQLDLARQEMGLKADEQDFNMLNELRNQGYGYNAALGASDSLKQRLGLPSNDQIRYDDEMRRRAEEERRKNNPFYRGV